MFRSTHPSFSITIARGALESIFDECDQFDSHETGGRLIGTYNKKDSHYDIQVSGVLGPGPQAQRSATSFFQDGEYQERIFRQIEQKYPEIEHLGNWHTHHVNGFGTLSRGDHSTYRRVVNHENHNTDFFYALLVVNKNRDRAPRYDVKHYLFRRNDDRVYEVSAGQVRVVDTPVVWPRDPESPSSQFAPLAHSSPHSIPNLERVKDQEFFADFYPALKALFSKNIGALYWKGQLALVDGSHADVVAIENPHDETPTYSISAIGGNSMLLDVSRSYKDRRFPSARHAVFQLERDLNQAKYRCKKG